MTVLGRYILSTYIVPSNSFSKCLGLELEFLLDSDDEDFVRQEDLA